MAATDESALFLSRGEVYRWLDSEQQTKKMGFTDVVCIASDCMSCVVIGKDWYSVFEEIGDSNNPAPYSSVRSLPPSINILQVCHYYCTAFYCAQILVVTDDGKLYQLEDRKENDLSRIDVPPICYVVKDSGEDAILVDVNYECWELSGEYPIDRVVVKGNRGVYNSRELKDKKEVYDDGNDAEVKYNVNGDGGVWRVDKSGEILVFSFHSGGRCSL